MGSYNFVIQRPVFSSPELKAQVSFSVHLCPSVRLSVCLSVRLQNFHIFIFFSRTTGPISTKLGTKHPRVKGIQVCSNEGPHPFPRGDNYTNSENTLKKFKNLLLQNYWANPWVKGIQVCSNEGPSPFPRGDNNEILKIHIYEILKSSFPEPLGQFQPILAQSILG